jgi:hypothetical protein
MSRNDDFNDGADDGAAIPIPPDDDDNQDEQHRRLDVAMHAFEHAQG